MEEKHVHSRTVSIIGLGYVGLPLAIQFNHHGFHVVGVDVDSTKINHLYHKKSYLTDVRDEQINELMNSNRFVPTTDYTHIRKTSACILCVPTPLQHNRTPDLRYLKSALASVCTHLSANQLVVLESSTFPGTTEEVIQPVLERSGFEVGKDVFLGYSPERIDPGNKKYKLEDIPKVVSGVTAKCRQRVEKLYGRIFRHIVPVSTPTHAEMTKLLENSQRFVNISFMNEMMMLCHKLNINIWEVIDAAKTKPYGFTPYYPGPGIGGHCIPVDPLYLSWKAEQFGFQSQFIELAKKMNDALPAYVTERVLAELPARQSAKRRLLLIGVAYKKDVNDVRESPAVTIMHELRQHDIDVDYHDPIVPEVTCGAERIRSVALDPDVLRSYDGVVILTDHSNIDYDRIVRHARLVFDTRHVVDWKEAHVKTL